MQPLQFLLDPIPIPTFLHNHWEQQPLVINRDVHEYYHHILDPGKLDALLNTLEASYPQIKLFKNNQPIDLNRWTSPFGEESKRIADMRKVMAHLHDGATLILNRLDHVAPTVQGFIQALEAELQFKVGANAYITPPHAQGFGPHYDSHDVFILPLSGAKQFRLYPSPVALPLEQLREKVEQQFDKNTDPNEIIELKAGDLLYIPRGVFHDAITLAQPSVHLTLGLHPHYGWHLLKALSEKAIDTPAFRKALPLPHADEKDKDSFNKQIRQAINDLLSETPLDSLQDQLHRNYILNKRQVNQGRLSDLLAIDELTADSMVGLRPNCSYHRSKDDRFLYLALPGDVIEIPLFLEVAVDFVLSQEQFRISDLPGPMKDGQKVEWVKKLVRKGLLGIH